MFGTTIQTAGPPLRSHPSPRSHCPLSHRVPVTDPQCPLLMSPIHTRVRWNVHFPFFTLPSPPGGTFPFPAKKKFNSDQTDFRSLSALIVSLIIMNRERFDQNLNVGRHFHRPLQRLTKAICFNLSRSFLAHESVVNWNEIGHFHLPSAR